MTARIKLRKYQEEAVTAVTDAVTVGQLQRVAVVLPTGMGKTVVFAHLARIWPRTAGGGQVVVLVHRDELIGQAVDKLRQVDPDLTVGRVKGQTWELNADVIVASVQTVSRRANLNRLLLETDVSLVIVDECHHAAAATWVATLEGLNCFTPGGPPAVGFTATLARTDDRGLGDVFQEVVFRKNILDGIAGGHLVMPRGRAVPLEGLDLSEAKVSAGDFTASSLGALLATAGAMDAVAKTYADEAPGRPGVVFWPTVATAERAAEAMRAMGVRAAAVSGTTPLEERRAILAGFARGTVDVLHNAMLLTEGWDAPRAEVCVIARPTRSPGLYTQMVGRVLRPFPGKTSALVLDVVGASRDHRLATLAELAEGRIRQVMDGESLADALAREELADLEDATVTGPAPERYTLESVDLFQRSSSLWLTTAAGCWFIPVDNGWVFLWPSSDPDRYLVGWKPEVVRQAAGQAPERGHWVSAEALDLEYAMDVAEAAAATMNPGGMNLSQRSASWRKRRDVATDAQRNVARALGVPAPPGTLKRELSDQITSAKASRALDAVYLAALDALAKEQEWSDGDS